jgi:hypothetical protein
MEGVADGGWRTRCALPALTHAVRPSLQNGSRRVYSSQPSPPPSYDKLLEEVLQLRVSKSVLESIRSEFSGLRTEIASSSSTLNAKIESSSSALRTEMASSSSALGKDVRETMKDREVCFLSHLASSF